MIDQCSFFRTAINGSLLDIWKGLDDIGDIFMPLMFNLLSPSYLLDLEIWNEHIQSTYFLQ